MKLGFQEVQIHFLKKGSRKKKKPLEWQPQAFASIAALHLGRMGLQLPYAADYIRPLRK